ncbi:MAG TPA: hypothetical protein VKW78_23130 [Terriglobales bacterium]|nr:hypothetical protein [Terriglobales bacterium]
MKITIGKSIKYKRVKLAPARVIAMYKAGKCVSDIAQACGYPRGHGNNRVRPVLQAAGVYRKPQAA